MDGESTVSYSRSPLWRPRREGGEKRQGSKRIGLKGRIPFFHREGNTGRQNRVRLTEQKRNNDLENDCEY